MIPLLLLGTPDTFEYALKSGTTGLPSGSTLPSKGSNSQPLISGAIGSLVSDIEKHDLMKSLQGHLTHVMGLSHIPTLRTHLSSNPQWTHQALCLLMTCFEPQDCLADWRQALHAEGIPYQVIHSSPEDLNEKVLLALSAHAQSLGLTRQVLREMPKERPRMGPCECCASAECERKLFDFLTHHPTH